MILLDAEFRFKYRSLVRRVRREKIRCVELEPDLWYVARRARGHGRYHVYLDATKTGLFATCRTIKNEACPSYNGCVHVASVYESLRAKLNKIEREKKRGKNVMKEELPASAQKVLDSFSERMKEHLANIDDFSAAIEEGGSPDEIVDNWQARTLLRMMPDEAQEN